MADQKNRDSAYTYLKSGSRPAPDESLEVAGSSRILAPKRPLIAEFIPISREGNQGILAFSPDFFPKNNGFIRSLGGLRERVGREIQGWPSRKTASRGLPESGQVPNLPFEEDNATENLCAIFCFRPTWTPSNLTKGDECWTRIVDPCLRR